MTGCGTTILLLVAVVLGWLVRDRQAANEEIAELDERLACLEIEAKKRR